MEKIIVTGSPGSGKTVLANRIGQIFDLDVIHLDYYLWEPGWKKISKEDRIEKIEEKIKGDKWILDGKYLNIFDFQLSKADGIIFIDLPRHVYIPQIIKQYIICSIQGCEEVAPGCPYTLRLSYIESMWMYPIRERNIFLQKILFNPRNLPFLELHSFKEINIFLAKLENTKKLVF